MVFSKYKANFILFLISISILFILLFLIVNKIDRVKSNENKYPYTSIIDYSDSTTKIYVEYPRYNNDKFNSIITNFIYSYIKEFKKNSKNKHLYINYTIDNTNENIDIMFYINNSLSNTKYKNIIIKKENIN